MVLVLVLLGVGVVATRALGGDEAASVRGYPFPLEDGPSGQPDEDERFAFDVDCEWGCEVAASGERVFVGEAQDEDGETEIMAYDVSGEDVWDRTESIDGVTNIEAFDGHLLVSGADGTTSLDPGDGSERWTADGDVSWVLDGDLVILEDYDDDEGETSVSVVDLATGDERWDATGSADACGSTVAVANEDDVSLRDASSGDERWSERTDGFVAGCSDSAVAMVDGDELLVLAGSDGSEIGSVRVDDDDDGATVGVFDGDVFVSSGGEVSRHRVSGDLDEVWSTDGPDYAYGIFEVDGAILVVGDSSELFATSDGSSRGRLRSSDEGVGALTASTILLGDDDTIEAFGLDDLEERWSFDVDDVRDVAAAGGRLYVLTDDELLGFA